MSVKAVLRPLAGSNILHSITTDRTLSHEISKMPISTAKNLAEIFGLQPLALLLGI